MSNCKPKVERSRKVPWDADMSRGRVYKAASKTDGKLVAVKVGLSEHIRSWKRHSRSFTRQQSLPPPRYHPLPAPPFANDQGFDDDGDDDHAMYIGGDEEERALFEEKRPLFEEKRPLFDEEAFFEGFIEPIIHKSSNSRACPLSAPNHCRHPPWPPARAHGGEDELSMYLGGNEEEKALFGECIEPTANVSIPKATSHVALPPHTTDSTEVVAEKGPTLHHLYQQQEQQAKYGSYGWLDHSADASMNRCSELRR
ncbi:hypothetical protein PG991_000774 [Apiospora marii]|uniref:Uncharacterized protein n=1 Tax=Apiospora marii TaxID=335849 RepID=A0ABR1SV91_9PEZI